VIITIGDKLIRSLSLPLSFYIFIFLFSISAPFFSLFSLIYNRLRRIGSLTLPVSSFRVSHLKQEQSHETNPDLSFRFQWRLRLTFDDKFFTIDPDLKIVEFDFEKTLPENRRIIMGTVYRMIDFNTMIKYFLPFFVSLTRTYFVFLLCSILFCFIFFLLFYFCFCFCFFLNKYSEGGSWKSPGTAFLCVGTF